MVQGLKSVEESDLSILPAEQELADFDQQNTREGRLGRYLKGRSADRMTPFIILGAIAGFTSILSDPWLGLRILLIVGMLRCFEIFLLGKFYGRGIAFWAQKPVQYAVLANSGIQACANCWVAVELWHLNGQLSHLPSIAVLIAFSMHAGFFGHLFWSSSRLEQALYSMTGLALFLQEFFHETQSNGSLLSSDLAAVFGVSICLIASYAKLERFARTRHASERRLMVSKLAAEEAHATMLHQARHDSLTGLPNRGYLAEVMDAEMPRARTEGGQIVIFHIDLDKFKEVNDTSGHAAGDFVLKQSADALRRSVRSEDFVARIGGDEFVVLASSNIVVSEMYQIAERIVAEISTPMMFQDQELRVGASVGFALSEERHTSGEAVLLDADLALYEAKDDGRGVVRAFVPQMRAEFEERTRLVNDLIVGIEKEQIETVFQPQVDLHSNLVTGFEALVRWRHPELGLLSPAKFVPLADESGLLNDITTTVARQSLEAISGWRKAGYKVPSVGLNFASRQLQDTEIINQIKWLVEAAGLEPEDVTIEVLESVLSSSNSDDLIKNVKALSAAGFSIDLDDFGTEHASIANMRSFEVQRIKIDKSFIKDIESRPDQRRLVSAMVQMARSLDVQVLAEGVETGAEIEILSELGCDQVQGYFFAKPMDYEASLTWLAECGLIVRSHVEQDLSSALF